ncbi:ankyrin [Ascobolus immersus RN42]|uniref:Ankyrin n=1 Tax=Ascobolus immersus RN42 TaxID=1160509 RepID=A0A3N4I5Q9_ASCIM|nr:ankyrin [Ascobolus immersus RN42]
MTTFTSLPTDLHLTIADFLPLPSISSLARTSKALNTTYTPSLLTTAAADTIALTKLHFSCDLHWASDYHSTWTRNLSRSGTTPQVLTFLTHFSHLASRTSFGTPPPDVPFTSDPLLRIPLAILRTALSRSSRRSPAFINALSAHIATNMNIPGWSPVQSILENPTLITSGHADILVNNGLDLNILYDGFSRPLQAAIMDAQVGTVKWLVHSGADVNAIDGFDGLEWTPVNAAVGSWREENGKTMVEILRFLVEEAGADINGLPGAISPFAQLGTHVQQWLRVSASRPDATKKGCRILKTLLPLFVRWKANPSVFAPGSVGGGPLHWLVDERQHWDPTTRLALMKGLIKLGAPVNLQDEKGATPLLKAMNCTKDKLMDGAIRVLIKKGADVFAKDRSGETVLHMAKRRGRRDLVELMRPGEWEEEGSESESS